LAGDGGPDTRHVSWEVLLTENGCGEDTTKPSSSNDDASEDGTFSVAGDVVGALEKPG